MKMPRAAPDAVARFERLCPTGAGITVRTMFGQPAAFVTGNMFLGVFGDAVFLRLSEEDRAAGLLLEGARLFEPMPGRPMREYVVLPSTILGDAARARPWVDRAVRYARGLGPKKPRPAARPKGR
jgi:TfoX/Sxy family transcriptional regulator of competence genes